MDGGMRSVETLEEALESGVVSDVVGHEEVHICLGESGVDHHLGENNTWGGTGEGGSGKVGLKDEVTTDVVRSRIGDSNIRESTGGDLEVVVGVSPGTKTTGSVVVEDGRVKEVRGI